VFEYRSGGPPAVAKVGQRKNRIPNMINIVERPAEAEDRAVPGHWAGDLIIGRKNLSAIGTFVERTSNYTMLLHLPDGYTPELVRDALAAKIKTLPEMLRASLTWDQGPEMRDWKQVAIATDLSIHTAEDLDWVAAELNDRPRKRLRFRKPVEQITDLLLAA
jgi:transposase, IS30 family